MFRLLLVTLVALVALTSSAQATIKCTVCKLVVQYAESYIQSHPNATTAAVEKDLDKVCKLLGHKLNATCVNIVDSYAPVIVQFASTLSPDQVCQKIKLCPTTTALFALAVAQQQAPAAQPKPADSGLCSVCETIVTFVDSYVQSNPNATEQEVEAALNVVCSYLGSLEQECTNFVDGEVPAIIQYATSLPPNQACQALGACTANATQTQAVVAAAAADKKRQSGGCSLCEFVASYVESYVQQNPNATVAEIEAELDSVCGYLGSLNASCVAMVDAYTPQIVQYVATMTPMELCGTLGLCSSSPQAAAIAAALPGALARQAADRRADRVGAQLRQFSVARRAAAPRKTAAVALTKPQPDAGGLCSICELVVAYVDSYIMQNPNATQQEIEMELDTVCSFLGSLATECTNFVNAEVPQIVQYAVSMTPEQACSTLGACQNATVEAAVKAAFTHAVAQASVAKPVSQLTADESMCSLCETVATFVDSYVASNENATIAMVENELDQVCALLGDLAQQCTSFVDQETPAIVNYVATMPPAQLCQTLGACAASSPQQVQQTTTLSSGHIAIA